MEKIEVKIDHREVLGKKVKRLRQEGITPVHLIGHGVESQTLQCDTADLKQVLRSAGHTRLVNLKIGKERKVHPALVREVQQNPITREILHVDFYQVKMEEKVKMDVPVLVVGESPLLKRKDTMLEQELNSLMVECLPVDIPESFEVDISPLVEVGQAIRVSDVAVPEGVSLLNDPEQPILKIDIIRVAAVEEEVAEAAEEAEAEGEGEAEGEAEAAPEAAAEESE